MSKAFSIPKVDNSIMDILSPKDTSFGSSPKTNLYSTCFSERFSLNSDSILSDKSCPFDNLDGLFNNFTKSASQITYLCKDQNDESDGFMAIPHLGGHGAGAAAFTARVFERWLMDKTYLNASNQSEMFPTKPLPFFNISGEELADSFLSKLMMENLSSQSTNQIKAAIMLRLGPTSELKECSHDDGVRLVAQQFMSTYPLYLEVSIRDLTSSKSSTRSSDSTHITPVGSVSSHFSLELDDLSIEDFDDQKNIVSVTTHDNHTEIRFFVCS